MFRLIPASRTTEPSPIFPAGPLGKTGMGPPAPSRRRRASGTTAAACLRGERSIIGAVGLIPILLAAHLLAVAAPARAAGPLQDLAALIPGDAPGMIALSDIAATRRALAPFLRDLPERDRGLMAFSSAIFRGGFNGRGIYGLDRAMPDRLGFGTADIAAIASWRDGWESPVIVTGLGNWAGTIGAALTGRGFATGERGGLPVWSRFEDFDYGQDDAADALFGPAPDTSQRFALRDGALLFTRAWPAMEHLLASPDRLSDDRDTAAILAAGYASTGMGTLTDAILLGAQPVRQLDAARILLQPGKDLDTIKKELQEAVATRPPAGTARVPPLWHPVVAGRHPADRRARHPLPECGVG